MLLLWANGAFVCFSQNTATQQSAFQQFVATASAALEAGNNAAAEHDFREALALDPSSVPLINNLAISIARQQREPEAVALYQEALQLKPGDSVTQRNLGLAYFSARDYAKALPLLENVAKQDPTFTVLKVIGIDLFALDRYPESAHYFEGAQRLRPADLETLDWLGKTYTREKNYMSVVPIFRQMLAINPNSAEAHVMMATAYDQLFRETDAIQEFQAAFASDPAYPGIHTGLGIIYFRNDNRDAAEREFRAELARHPDDPVANSTLGRILEGRNQPTQAVPFLQAALAVNPSYADALLALGECQLSLNLPDAAIATFQREVALSPGDAQAHYILGSAYNRAGKPAEGARQRLLCSQLRATQRHEAQISTQQSAQPNQ